MSLRETGPPELIMRHFKGFQTGVRPSGTPGQSRIFLLAVSMAVNIPAAPLRSFRSGRCRVIATDIDAAKLEGLSGESQSLDVRPADTVRALAAASDHSLSPVG
jgi:hypothetical protein